MWNTIIYFLKKEAVIVEETFWNCYVNVGKNYFFNFVILQYIQWIFI